MTLSLKEQGPNSAILRDVFVARQPIYTSALKVYGYELLFRSGETNSADFVDGARATSQTMLNAFVELGSERVVGERLAFVNLTREFLTGEFPLPIGPESMVIEVLEDIPIDDELVEGIAQLSSKGYTIALDDIVFNEKLAPLLDVADIVKVELPEIPQSELASHVAQLRKWPVKLLAEKIETHDEFQFCKDLGFDLYQGYFLSRPRTLSGKQLSTSALAVAQLLAKLGDPDISFAELEAIIQNDATLCYKLLRYINSSHFALKHKIESLHKALVLLGVAGVRKLAMLIALAGATHMPRETITNAVIRAKACELLGQQLGQSELNTFFTVGLLSSLDALLDVPMDEVMESLPLSEEITGAILDNEGMLGDVLRLIISYERAEWANIMDQTIDPTQVRDAYLEGVTAATEFAAAI